MSVFDSGEWPVIHRYTRAQALADGVLVDLTKLAPEVCLAHFKEHVACTAGVWGIIEAAVKSESVPNDLAGVLHDIFTMFRLVGRPVDPNTRAFTVIIRGVPQAGSHHRLKLHRGPGDEGEAVLTLMLREED